MTRLRGITLSLSLLVWLSSCGNTHDNNLERVLAARLTDFKKSNETSLDLTPIFGSQWEKICIQGPYEPKEHFEERVGRKVQGNPGIDENIFIWWIFYSNGTTQWVQVNRVKVMDSHNKLGTPCTTVKNPKIYAATSFGVRSYYFNDK